MKKISPFFLFIFIFIIAFTVFFLTARNMPDNEADFDIFSFSDFPSLHITVDEDPFDERDLRQDGYIRLSGDGWEDFSFEDTPAMVRGRGNSTWRFGEDKRPLRFRFDVARTMLDSGHEARNWILLAEFFDPALMRNYFALSLGHRLDGLDFTPFHRFVHLYVNGEYMGVYQLTDERNLEPGRQALILDDDPSISEYFLELDNPRNTWGVQVEGEDFFRAGKRAYDLRFPDHDERDAHIAYAQTFLENFSAVLQSQNWEEIQKWIDIPSFVDFYLIQELVKNVDIGFFSVFFTIRGQGDDRKIHMGPLWDFDQSIGNTNNNLDWDGPLVVETYHPYGLAVPERNYWYGYLMEIPEFFALVSARFDELLYSEFLPAIAHVEQMAQHFEAAFSRNFDRHPIFTQHPHWFDFILNPYVASIDSWEGQVHYLLDWLSYRLAWLNTYFAENTYHQSGLTDSFSAYLPTRLSLTADIPVLMYHHITENPSNSMEISPETFDMHMQTLYDEGFTTITLTQLIAFVDHGSPLPERPVIVTFDDGYLSMYEYAFPVLERLGQHAINFVIGSAVGTQYYRDTNYPTIPKFTFEQAARMAGVVDIQSHTYDMHQWQPFEAGRARANILIWEDEDVDSYIEILRHDHQQMIDIVHEHLGTEIIAIGFPLGHYDELVHSVLTSMGLRVSFSTRGRMNTVTAGSAQSLLALGRFHISDHVTAEDLLAIVTTEDLLAIVTTAER